MRYSCALILSLVLLVDGSLAAAPAPSPKPLQPMDVFELEWAEDPRISPDGKHVAYVRRHADVMGDTWDGDLWVVRTDGSEHRPLVADASSPRWSPDGKRLLYTAKAGSGTQLFVRWMDTGVTAQVTRLLSAPAAMEWSPDGRSIAFVMPVPEDSKPFATPLTPPEGAKWAPDPKVIERLKYRADGQGYLKAERSQVFVVTAEGGTPRQLTTGEFDHDGPLSWTPDGKYLLLSANRHDDAEYEPLNSEIHELSVDDGSLRALTSRKGPDRSPAISPDGRRIAYVGFDDTYQGYEPARLSVMERSGGAPRTVTAALDRDIVADVRHAPVQWTDDSRSLVVLYEDQGRTRLATLDLDGRVRTLAVDVGGLSFGRPYTSGQFSVSGNGLVAYTQAGPGRLSDIAVVQARGGTPRRLTNLSVDLFGQRELGRLEEFWVSSAFDGKRIQAWLIKPPGFDPSKKHPMVLEIHGGPFQACGPMFAMEQELYAAAGNVVVYANPRGSTSYGREFGNAIHHAYPGNDYDDLMSVVDAVVARGFVDPERLFVTGGSGGGTLTAWIVGKTDRFRAAVSQKPVINWTSFSLTADAPSVFWRYWFPGSPWEKQQDYFARSPLSLVGNVKTPTMVLTGEEDYRTPISEAEQYYQALKIRKVPTALARIPGAGHGLDARPSQLANRIALILAWFARHDPKAPPPPASAQ
jgi:acylaminoacyl-peptidase